MGSTHNPDHYKVGGSRIEERGIASRDRRRLGIETARLQRKAAIGAPSSGKTPPARLQTNDHAEPLAEAPPARVRIQKSAVEPTRLPNALPVHKGHEPLPRVLQRTEKVARSARWLAGRAITLGIELISAPLTIARVLRKLREDEE